MAVKPFLRKTSCGMVWRNARNTLLTDQSFGKTIIEKTSATEYANIALCLINAKTDSRLEGIVGGKLFCVQSGRSSHMDLRRKEAEINLDAEKELIDNVALSAILGRFQRDAINWERSP
ncbi:hypothetical protein CDAR_304731 [Caerostris darwini]|uniref:Uncharacterized protein n=1 Tax=Caerostris darwini TaxID=1538125 RepID=A0AAV4PR94_9ARAC|nr:hypothetical protein CDAR_304731 [Caerostris darwini]